MSALPKITLASKITLVRIMGIPVFVLLMIYYLLSLSRGAPNEYYRFAALILFFLVAATDALDGWVARKRNEETRLGRILDPIADKALMLSALILCTRPGTPDFSPQLPVWYTLSIIARDGFLVVGAIAIHLLHKHVEVHARITGKVTTFLQIAVIVWVLTGFDHPAFYVPVIAAALGTFISWVQYLIDGLHQLGEEEPEPTG